MGATIINQRKGKIALKVTFKDSFEQSNLMSDCRKKLPENAWTLHKYILKNICFMPDRDNTIMDCINNGKVFSIHIPYADINEQFGDATRFYRQIKSSLEVLNTTLVQWVTIVPEHELPKTETSKKGVTALTVQPIVGKNTMTTLISSSTFSYKEGLRVNISNEMLGLYMIGNNYTIMDMALCSMLQSRGAQFLYEKLCQYRNCISFSYTPEEFKVDYGCTSYTNFKIKDIVILPAIKELKDLHSEYLDFEEVKGGKGNAILEWRFIVKNKDPQKETDKINMLINEIVAVCSEYYRPHQIANLRRLLGTNEVLIQSVRNKIEVFLIQKRKGKMANAGGYLYACIKEAGVDLNSDDAPKESTYTKTTRIDAADVTQVPKKRGRPKKVKPAEAAEPELQFPEITQPAFTATAEWDCFLKEILAAVGEKTFGIWFTPIVPVSYINNDLTIRVPSKFFFETLEVSYITQIGAALKSAFGPDVKLHYNIL